MNKTSFTKYFLVAFTLMFISSGLSAGTFDLDGKKKGKEKKEELSADGPYVIYQPVAKRVLSVWTRKERLLIPPITHCRRILLCTLWITRGVSRSM